MSKLTDKEKLKKFKEMDFPLIFHSRSGQFFAKDGNNIVDIRTKFSVPINQDRMVMMSSEFVDDISIHPHRNMISKIGIFFAHSNTKKPDNHYSFPVIPFCDDMGFYTGGDWHKVLYTHYQEIDQKYYFYVRTDSGPGGYGAEQAFWLNVDGPNPPIEKVAIFQRQGHELRRGMVLFINNNDQNYFLAITDITKNGNDLTVDFVCLFNGKAGAGMLTTEPESELSMIGQVSEARLRLLCGTKKTSGCECGAAKMSFDTYHSSWCPLA